MNFCTLFDSYYLDKGIALYQSLESVSDKFTLFIFCFDDESYQILKKLNFSHAIILRNSVFENEELLRLKLIRSKAEYCWTCTPVIIKYILDNYEVDGCTYIDADLFFYSDPQQLFDEIDDAKADVAIVEHRFKDNRYGRKLEKRNGKYCVQFNYFRKTDQAYTVLEQWREQCADWCYDIPEPERMGDQKYLNTWTEKYSCVHEMQHLGGGVAPWNLEQYVLSDTNHGDIYMSDAQGNRFQLIFFHFQNMRYICKDVVNIKSQTQNKQLKYTIYIPYLKKIESIRKMLSESFNMSYDDIKIVRSSNFIVGFLQKNLASLKIQYLSDIIQLRKLDRYLL